jgi:dCTP diphosphatase
MGKNRRCIRCDTLRIFPIVKIEEQPKIRFRSREGFCLASLGCVLLTVCYTPLMKTIKELTEQVVSFRDARDWKQFHRPKDMALSLMLEAAEVGEVFQWKSDDQITLERDAIREKLERELSDVLYWVLLMAHDSEIQLEQAFQRKLFENEHKYPVELSRGSSKKYSELEEK